MINSIIQTVKKIPFISGDTPLAQLIRTYFVGGFNLIFGLFLRYIFQFFNLNNIEVPIRTYLTEILAFFIGVIVSYFISRKVIFKLSINKGRLKEFSSFVFTNLISLIIPLFVWFLINEVNPAIQENEFQYLLTQIIIHGTILPLKYVIYKFFVFKDSLNS